MREYSNKISLTKNSRGIYSLDTSIGCNTGMNNEVGGCYNDCYAAKSAKLYGYDFSKTVLRDFENEYHRRFILNQINKIPLDFIRIGTSGDPSENWKHTIKIIKQIDKCNKEIIVITKHWNNLQDEDLKYFNAINISINTSVSALDKATLLNNSIEQYNRIKSYCKSILRIVSCDFNLNNNTGKKLAELQNKLFENDSTLDTVLRINKNNKLVKDGIINIKKINFLHSNSVVSKFNKKTYFGKCSSCIEMCGFKINTNILYKNKPGIFIQQKLF